MQSYAVLDPVSQAYPKVQGRSPTCYSPVRHSSTPERAFPFDLHVLSTPPAFVLSQDQTLQTKTPPHRRRIQSEQSEPNKKTPKTGINQKTDHTHTREAQMRSKKTTTKTKPPNTLLSSQTTPHRPRNKTHGSWPLTRCADDERTPPKWNFPLGHRRARRADRVAATRLSYATGNLESNKLLDGVFRAAPESAHAFDPGDISLAAA